MSPPEVLLWTQVRRKKLGFKVLRQHPIGPYSADFYVPSARLVIEIDGSAHDYGQRPNRDQTRDGYIEHLGCRVLRISAGDVMKNLEGVLSFIAVRAANPLHHPHPGEER